MPTAEPFPLEAHRTCTMPMAPDAPICFWMEAPVVPPETVVFQPRSPMFALPFALEIESLVPPENVS
ncbi:MAG TPA: hypothetical protein VIU86_19980 [Gaiellaceae bacterium]